MENTEETNRDYQSIDRPYDSNLNRSEANDNNGNVMEQPVKSDGDMGDIWVRTFIRSENWHPKKVGFYLNGQTGYAEFTNVYISGNIQALSGTIGGFVIGDHTISSGDLVFSSRTAPTSQGGGGGEPYISIGDEEFSYTIYDARGITMYDASSPGLYNQPVIQWVKSPFYTTGESTLTMQKRSGDTGNAYGSVFEMYYTEPPAGYYNAMLFGGTSFGNGNENTAYIEFDVNIKTAEAAGIVNGTFSIQSYQNGTFVGNSFFISDDRNVLGTAGGVSAFLQGFNGGAAGFAYGGSLGLYQGSTTSVTLANHLIPLTDGVYDMGSTSRRISNIYSENVNSDSLKTSNSQDYIAISDSTASGYSTTSIAFIDSGVLVGAIEPLFNVTGNGAKYVAYDNGLNPKGHIEIYYNTSSATSEININPDGPGSDGLNLTYLDGDTYVLIDFEGSRVDSPISPLPGTPSTSDLGRSDSMWDDIWCDEIHYVTATIISDQILKKDVTPISYGLNEVLKLNPVEFKWKKDNKPGIGFIAQEVQKTMPNAVKEVMQKEHIVEKKKKTRNVMKNGVMVEEKYTEKKKRIEVHKVIPEGGDPDGPGLLQIDMTPMIPMLVKAIQELNKKIEKLEKK